MKKERKGIGKKEEKEREKENRKAHLSNKVVN